MNKEIDKKFKWLKEQLKDKDPNEILGEVYLHVDSMEIIKEELLERDLYLNGLVVKHVLKNTVLKKEIETLQDYLELAVGQSNQCPICRRYDFRELGHKSDCFMRTLPNGNVQYVGEDK